MNIPESYELIEKRQVPDVASEGYLLSHKKTGARIFVLENNDENKVFSIGFRTTPTDSTGVAHIIEHTVLCGSEKYPAKDPFVELVKGSLNTFLNAMTYPDKTVFPVASCNDKDFQNLMSVYMDAVFHPNIYRNPMLFEQEGWHYELEDEKAPLIYNGVVYNEMKGAYSSADDILNELITQALYPDTEYAHDSGGFPADIPNLTYENFLDFHRRYYHPSNSFVYLYGNADMEEKLRWIDEAYFSQYDRLEIDSMPKAQAAFDAPKELRGVYGITEDEEEENHTYLAWGRVIGEADDPMVGVAFSILENVLLSNPGAPVKQALIDAGIGDDIYGYYADSMRQPYFIIVAKGANESQKDEFVRIIEETIAQVVKDGIDRKTLQAGLNCQEFTVKEADFGNYPKGLIFGLDTMGYWLYNDRAVFGNLQLTDIFTQLREKMEQGYFEGLLQTRLLENPHGATVVLVPERGLNEKRDEAQAAVMAEKKAAMSDEEIARIVAHTKELKIFQDTPSTKEELEMIPMLSVADVATEAISYSNLEKEIEGVLTVHHDYFTSGIAYISLGFDLESFDLTDIPYLSLLTGFMGNVDTENYSYQELGVELRLCSGGMGAGMTVYDTDDVLKVQYEFGLKALKEQVPQALKMAEEVLLRSRYSDKKRIKELLVEAKSRLNSSMMERSDIYAGNRAYSYYNTSSYIEDQKGGIAYYEFLDDLSKNFDEKADALCDKLTELARNVVNKAKLIISFTGDSQDYEGFAEAVTPLLRKLPTCEMEKRYWSVELQPKNEGFKTSAQVNYVARCGNYRLADPDLAYTGALRVLKIWLGYEYLWVNIRVKGGAYGCFSVFTRQGDVKMVSYRDPHVKETSDVFLNAAETIGKIELSDRDLTKYILGAVNELDSPQSPNRKGVNAMTAYLLGITHENMQTTRDQVLGTTVEDLRNCARLIDAALGQGYVCAIGASGKIEEAGDLFAEVKPLFH